MYRSHVLVCGGTGCTSSGSQRIIDRLEKEIAAQGLSEEVGVVKTGCFGLCALGPIMIVYPEGTFYSMVQEDDIPEIVAEHLLKGRVVTRLLYEETTKTDKITPLNETNFYKKQHRVALRNCGVINPEDIEEYIGTGGYEALGIVLTEKKPEEQKKRIVVNAPGRFSVYNSLAAIAVAEHYQVPWNVMEQVLHTLQVPGRIEMLSVSPRFIVLVDYAHNAMALEALLTTLQDYHPGRIICIFGCGGNRSAERRFQMGEVAGRLADLVVVTTDNPRDEDPEKIADEICRGLDATKGKYGRIPDRGDAIAYGISHAKPGDIVVIAGKGHEKYQEICGQKFPMDDRQLAMKCKVW